MTKITEFIIKSSTSDLTLMLSDINGDYFKVTLKSFHLNTTREVYAYTDGDGFAKMFERLASYNKPWAGEEIWESLEGEFKLSANCSTLGQVTFKINLSYMGCSEEWSVETDLLYEFGQLEKLAKSARAFFGESVA